MVQMRFAFTNNRKRMLCKYRSYSRAMGSRAIEQGLHCVAVTDHNKPLGMKAIQEAAKDKPITVYPCVEITCDTTKIHLLILFDPSKGEEAVKSFLSKCDIEHTNYGKQAAITNKSVIDVAQIASKKCITIKFL